MAKKAYVYSGTEWVPLASEVTDLTPYSTSTEIANTYATKAENGLVHIETQDFSAVSSFNFSNDVFIDDYANYRLVMATSASTDMSLLARLRSAGTSSSAASYNFQGVFFTSTSVSASRSTGQTSFRFGSFGATAGNAVVDIFNPKASLNTSFSSKTFDSQNGAGIAEFAGYFTATTSFDSLEIFPSTGTITGKASLYGYRNS